MNPADLLQMLAEEFILLLLACFSQQPMDFALVNFFRVTDLVTFSSVTDLVTVEPAFEKHRSSPGPRGLEKVVFSSKGHPECRGTVTLMLPALQLPKPPLANTWTLVSHP